jgi:hypothetical protein
VRAFQIASALALSVAWAACSPSEAPPAAPETAPVEAAPPPGPSAPAAAKLNLPRVASVELGSALDQLEILANGSSVSTQRFQVR